MATQDLLDNSVSLLTDACTANERQSWQFYRPIILYLRPFIIPSRPGFSRQKFRQTLLNLLHRASDEGGGSLGTPEMNLAWRVMQLDLTTENPLRVTYGSIGKCPAAGSAMERPLQRGQYLFVDSVHPSEVIFHLSSISRWPVPSGKEANLSCSRGISFAPDVEELIIPPSSTEPLKRSSEVADRDTRPARSQTGELTNSSIFLHPPAPATLVIESFQWLSDHLGQPLKRIDVTGCRAISVCLPSGRHCLSIMVHSPLGFHLTVIGALRLPQVDKSSTDRPIVEDKLTDEKFSHPTTREARPISSAKGGQNTRTTCNMGSLLVQLGDEDCVLSTGLSQLPQRIRHHADQLVNSLYKLAIATASLSTPDSWPVPMEAPTNTWIPSPEQEVDLVISAAIAQDPEVDLNQRASLCVAEFYNRRSEVESLLRNNWTSDDYDRTGALGTRVRPNYPIIPLVFDAVSNLHIVNKTIVPTTMVVSTVSR
ncbi:hypothetical protein AHF37_03080 [Paragonimus kellicotti]|nr:hypothetical protein AHF37_03080 [Paragonimus kellicotti]